MFLLKSVVFVESVEKNNLMRLELVANSLKLRIKKSNNLMVIAFSK